MPTYLPAPAHQSGGPDGQGWNRLTLAADLCGDECALRPRSYSTLWESLNRPALVQYGLYGPCVNRGRCGDCQVFTAAPRALHRSQPDDPRVMVRVFRDPGQTIGEPRVMAWPEGDPGEHWSWPWTWEELRRLEGWKLGRRGRDKYGEYFWLIDARDGTDGGA